MKEFLSQFMVTGIEHPDNLVNEAYFSGDCGDGCGGSNDCSSNGDGCGSGVCR